MLTKITDTAWIDMNELLIVSAESEHDSVKLLFKNSSHDWVILCDKLKEPFLKKLNEYFNENWKNKKYYADRDKVI